MRAAALGCAVLVSGCSLIEFYRDQTEGISPAKLVPLYFQEKRYTEDRTLEAEVRGALHGMNVEVQVYHGVVTLRGPEASTAAVATARSVFGVKAVRRQPE